MSRFDPNLYVGRDELGAVLDDIEAEIKGAQVADTGDGGLAEIPIIDTTFAPVFRQGKKDKIFVTLRFAQYGAADQIKVVMNIPADIHNADDYDQKRFTGNLGDDIPPGTTTWTAEIDIALEPNTVYNVIRLVAIAREVNRATNPPFFPSYDPVPPDDPGYPANIIYTFTTPDLFGVPSSPDIHLIVKNELDTTTVDYDTVQVFRVYAPLTLVGGKQSWEASGATDVIVVITDFGGENDVHYPHKLEGVELTQIEAAGTLPPGADSAYIGRGYVDITVKGYKPGTHLEWRNNICWVNAEKKSSTGPPVAFYAGNYTNDPALLTGLSLTIVTTGDYTPKFARVDLNFTQPATPVGLKNYTLLRKLVGDPDANYIQVLRRGTLKDDSVLTPGPHTVQGDAEGIRFKPTLTYTVKCIIRAIGGLLIEFTQNVTTGTDTDVISPPAYFPSDPGAADLVTNIVNTDTEKADAYVAVRVWADRDNHAHTFNDAGATTAIAVFRRTGETDATATEPVKFGGPIADTTQTSVIIAGVLPLGQSWDWTKNVLSSGGGSVRSTGAAYTFTTGGLLSVEPGDPKVVPPPGFGTITREDGGNKIDLVPVWLKQDGIDIIFFKHIIIDVAIPSGGAFSRDSRVSLKGFEQLYVTALASGAVAASGDITVNSTIGFTAAGAISIENELILYTSKDATHFLGCTRGADGTTAATHASGVRVSGAYREVQRIKRKAGQTATYRIQSEAVGGKLSATVDAVQGATTGDGTTPPAYLPSDPGAGDLVKNVVNLDTTETDAYVEVRVWADAANHAHTFNDAAATSAIAVFRRTGDSSAEPVKFGGEIADPTQTSVIIAGIFPLGQSWDWTKNVLSSGGGSTRSTGAPYSFTTGGLKTVPPGGAVPVPIFGTISRLQGSNKEDLVPVTVQQNGTDIILFKKLILDKAIGTDVDTGTYYRDQEVGLKAEESLYINNTSSKTFQLTVKRKAAVQARYKATLIAVGGGSSDPPPTLSAIQGPTSTDAISPPSFLPSDPGAGDLVKNIVNLDTANADAYVEVRIWADTANHAHTFADCLALSAVAVFKRAGDTGEPVRFGGEIADLTQTSIVVGGVLPLGQSWDWTKNVLANGGGSTRSTGPLYNFTTGGLKTAPPGVVPDPVFVSVTRLQGSNKEDLVSIKVTQTPPDIILFKKLILDKAVGTDVDTSTYYRDQEVNLKQEESLYANSSANKTFDLTVKRKAAVQARYRATVIGVGGGTSNAVLSAIQGPTSTDAISPPSFLPSDPAAGEIVKNVVNVETSEASAYVEVRIWADTANHAHTFADCLALSAVAVFRRTGDSTNEPVRFGGEIADLTQTSVVVGGVLPLAQSWDWVKNVISNGGGSTKSTGAPYTIITGGLKTAPPGVVPDPVFVSVSRLQSSNKEDLVQVKVTQVAPDIVLFKKLILEKAIGTDANIPRTYYRDQEINLKHEESLYLSNSANKTFDMTVKRKAAVQAIYRATVIGVGGGTSAQVESALQGPTSGESLTDSAVPSGIGPISFVKLKKNGLHVRFPLPTANINTYRYNQLVIGDLPGGPVPGAQVLTASDLSSKTALVTTDDTVGRIDAGIKKTTLEIDRTQLESLFPGGTIYLWWHAVNDIGASTEIPTIVGYSLATGEFGPVGEDTAAPGGTLTAPVIKRLKRSALKLDLTPPTANVLRLRQANVYIADAPHLTPPTKWLDALTLAPPAATSEGNGAIATAPSGGVVIPVDRATLEAIFPGGVIYAYATWANDVPGTSGFSPPSAPYTLSTGETGPIGLDSGVPDGLGAIEFIKVKKNGTHIRFPLPTINANTHTHNLLVVADAAAPAAGVNVVKAIPATDADVLSVKVPLTGTDTPIDRIGRIDAGRKKTTLELDRTQLESMFGVGAIIHFWYYAVNSFGPSVFSATTHATYNLGTGEFSPISDDAGPPGGTLTAPDIIKLKKSGLKLDLTPPTLNNLRLRRANVYIANNIHGAANKWVKASDLTASATLEADGAIATNPSGGVLIPINRTQLESIFGIGATIYAYATWTNDAIPGTSGFSDADMYSLASGEAGTDASIPGQMTFPSAGNILENTVDGDPDQNLARITIQLFTANGLGFDVNFIESFGLEILQRKYLTDAEDPGLPTAPTYTGQPIDVMRTSLFYNGNNLAFTFYLRMGRRYEIVNVVTRNADKLNLSAGSLLFIAGGVKSAYPGDTLTVPAPTFGTISRVDGSNKLDLVPISINNATDVVWLKKLLVEMSINGGAYNLEQAIGLKEEDALYASPFTKTFNLQVKRKAGVSAQYRALVTAVGGKQSGTPPGTPTLSASQGPTADDVPAPGALTFPGSVTTTVDGDPEKNLAKVVIAVSPTSGTFAANNISQISFSFVRRDDAGVISGAAPFIHTHKVSAAESTTTSLNTELYLRLGQRWRLTVVASINGNKSTETTGTVDFTAGGVRTVDPTDSLGVPAPTFFSQPAADGNKIANFTIRLTQDGTNIVWFKRLRIEVSYGGGTYREIEGSPIGLKSLDDLHASASASHDFVISCKRKPGVTLDVRALAVAVGGKQSGSPAGTPTNATQLAASTDDLAKDTAAPSSLAQPTLEWTAASKLVFGNLLVGANWNTPKSKYVVLKDAFGHYYNFKTNAIAASELAARLQVGLVDRYLATHSKLKHIRAAYEDPLGPNLAPPYNLFAHWYGENGFGISTSPSTDSAAFPITTQQDFLGNRDAVNVVDVGVTGNTHNNLLTNGDFLYNTTVVGTVNQWFRGVPSSSPQQITTASAAIQWDPTNHLLKWFVRTQPLVAPCKRRLIPGEYYTLRWLLKTDGTLSGTMSISVLDSTDAVISSAPTVDLSTVGASFFVFETTFQMNSSFPDFTRVGFLCFQTSTVLDSTNNIIFDKMMLVRGKQGCAFAARVGSNGYEGDGYTPGGGEDITNTMPSGTASNNSEVGLPSGVQGGGVAVGSAGRITYQTL